MAPTATQPINAPTATINQPYRVCRFCIYGLCMESMAFLASSMLTSLTGCATDQ
jgi:hypothetical protein